MGSTRLPGKVLATLAGRSVLEWTVRAAVASNVLSDVVVATSTESDDDAIVQACRALGVRCYRGPEDDVLTRFVGAVDGSDAEAFMRLTADCPLLDPRVLTTVAQTWRVAPGVDYVTTALPRTLPRGMDAEVMSLEALERVDRRATGFHRTHVTSYAYTHLGEFRVLGLTFPPDRSQLRLTLDTPDDLALIERVVESFGDRPADVDDVTAWLAARPDVVALNAHVEQKALQEG